MEKQDQTYTVKQLKETFEGKDGKEHKVYLVIKVTCYGVKPRTTNNITDIALADDIEIDEGYTELSLTNQDVEEIIRHFGIIKQDNQPTPVFLPDNFLAV